MKQRHYSLSIEEEDMGNSGHQSSKAPAISEGEEHTKIDLAVVLIGAKVKLEVLLIQHPGDVVAVPSRIKHMRGEDGEPLGLIGIGPVEERGHHVDDDEEAEEDVEDGEGRVRHRGSREAGGSSPVEAEGTETKAMEA